MSKFLYNGIEFPALPNNDKPYVVIIDKSGVYTAFYLSVIPTPKSGNIGVYTHYYLAAGDAYATCEFDATTQTWGAVTEEIASKSTDIFSTVYDFIWANYDIYHADDVTSQLAGKLILAASEPIPVGGGEPIDPTYFMQGWLVGRRIAAMRGKKTEEV